jgi:hypothetical protein
MRQAANPEVHLIQSAQHLVDHWFRSPKRGPFARAVHEAEQLWTEQRERAAFRRVANAIRLGQGHASFNPKPLVRIARETFRSH